MKDYNKIETALHYLASVGAPTGQIWRWLECEQAKGETRKPTDVDRAWLLSDDCGLEEHLAVGEGKVRPYLSCALVVGRAYCLTECQREVLREWFAMTCSETVEVLEVATFPGEDRVVREVVIRSEQHVDPQNKALVNGPRKVVIDRWGEFCSAVKVREFEKREQKEVDSLTARVSRLMDRAKKEKVGHRLRTPGDVAHQWHSEVQQAEVEGRFNGLTEGEVQRVKREMLKEILLAKGEQGLARLVMETSLVTGKLKEEFAEVEKEMDRLLAQLNVRK